MSVYHITGLSLLYSVQGLSAVQMRMFGLKFHGNDHVWEKPRPKQHFPLTNFSAAIYYSSFDFSSCLAKFQSSTDFCFFM